MRLLDPVHDLKSIVTSRTHLPPPPDRDDPRWTTSWEHLARVYTPAMERYVSGELRRRGLRVTDPDEPAAIVSSFLAKAMETGQLAEPEGGVRKFRAWITTQLKRHLNDHHKYVYAARRDPALRAPAEALASVGTQETDPALAQFDKGLVAIACERALARLQAGEGARRWGPTYAAILRDLALHEGRSSDDLAERLGVRPDELPGLRHRARQKLAALFVGELRSTVSDDDALLELLAEVEPYLP
jgi:DNA-directed RNA polymerase specialized sigma24 family protein